MNAANLHILNYENELRTSLRNLSSLVPNSDVFTFRHFDQLPLKQQEAILKALSFCQDLYQQILATEVIRQNELSLSDEIRFCRKALKKLGWKLKDESFFNLIRDENDVIEIYNKNYNQVYRSFSFFKYCCYSILDLLTYEWSELYDRPAHVNEMLFKFGKQMFTEDGTTMPYNIPPHVLIEKNEHLSRYFEVEMKYGSPVLDEVTNEPVGFISTFQAKELEFNGAHQNIQVLNRNRLR